MDDQQPVRRGVVIVAVVVLLVLVGFIVLGTVHGGAREQELNIRGWETLLAFYAAEAGMNMAAREIITDVDEDADGTVGSISDDDDDETTPPSELRGSTSPRPPP